jgi:AraC-like DNA-binding protein
MKVKKIIEDNHKKPGFTVEDFAQEICMSRVQLSRKIKALTGLTPTEFLRNYRLQKARFLIEYEDVNVTEAAHMVGFANPSYFTESFKKQFGKLPSKLNDQKNKH